MLEEFSRKKVCGQLSDKRQDRKSNGSRQKNKRGDRRVESSDSPEIAVRRETSNIPSLSSGREREERGEGGKGEKKKIKRSRLRER